LTYAPTGGIVAAATTSLPERLGGVRNWDYRYCWLRDATFTLLALMHLGYYDEARAWRDWLVRAVAGSPQQVQIMYGVGGERWLPELIVPWLPGYENSSPVRIGNGAYEQFQLDVFGETADAIFQTLKAGMKPSERGRALQPVITEYLATAWRQPDEGIGRSVGAGSTSFIRKSWPGSHLIGPRWQSKVKDTKIRRAGGARSPTKSTPRSVNVGLIATLNSFVQAYGSKRLDASLLLLPLVGFLPAADPRIKGTLAAIEDRLLIDNEFVLRYEPKSRRWPARRRRSFFGVQLLAC